MKADNGFPSAAVLTSADVDVNSRLQQQQQQSVCLAGWSADKQQSCCLHSLTSQFVRHTSAFLARHCTMLICCRPRVVLVQQPFPPTSTVLQPGKNHHMWRTGRVSPASENYFGVCAASCAIFACYSVTAADPPSCRL